MSYTIFWSPKAVETFENVIQYLSENWTQRQIKSLVDKTDDIINLLSKNPYLFRKSRKANIHEVLITEHNLLIYQINEVKKQVQILSIFDTRQNPKKKYK